MYIEMLDNKTNTNLSSAVTRLADDLEEAALTLVAPITPTTTIRDGLQGLIAFNKGFANKLQSAVHHTK
jgi:hypothetical protein